MKQQAGFFFNELAFPSWLIFKNQTTEFGIDLELSVNRVCALSRNEILNQKPCIG